jgi:hypothetical protein
MAKSLAAPVHGAIPFDATAAARRPRWLKEIDGDTPVFLIAPHGGHAGPAARATVNPKVNDLHTAEITRELADRLGAGAIINAGMDRNRLDLNRLSQVMSDAPWMLELIATRLERIAAQHGRAVVLLIHGWNVIEPRVDVGIGAKSAAGGLLPGRSAHVSASEGFINGPLLDFVEALARSGIEPTFGLRYPGAGADNLLQAFTERHASSQMGVLRRLAALSARGALEAVQLELSVALRLPGRLRAETIAAIAGSFARCDGFHARCHTNGAERPRRIQIIRTAETPPAPLRQKTQTPVAGPLRVGLEFYDPAARIGVMASFDLGAGAAGARVMAIAGRQRIALFTAEGRVERTAEGLRRGPLALCVRDGRLCFDFAGPAVVVDDGTAYLSVERALARAALQESMELHVEFEAWPAMHAHPGAPAETPIESITRREGAGASIFGSVSGHFSIGRETKELSAVARAGRSLIAIGNAAFRERRMVWAVMDEEMPVRAVEARSLIDSEGAEAAQARLLDRERWTDSDLHRLRVARTSSRHPPRRITALLRRERGGASLALDGEVDSFVMLSRPGPAQSRILTSLGFARFRIGDNTGAGMFECSHRAGSAAGVTAHPTDTDGD